jgi:hypothetical protein
VRRRQLLIDLDPARPKGISATAAQLEAARIKANEIQFYLYEIGWPSPSIAMSGNGYHLLYAIDLPNDEVTRDLLKSVLLSLGHRFDDQQTKVDGSVFNAARICKLYGTVANKGDHSQQQPHRLSRLIQTHARVEVTESQMQELVASLPTEATKGVSAVSVGPSRVGIQKNTSVKAPTDDASLAIRPFDLELFLTQHEIEYWVDQHDGRDRFKLENCPFNPAHVKGEAAIFRDPLGKLGFKCQHDSCADKTWRDVREFFDGLVPTDASTTSWAGNWPEPTPLPNALPPVAPFSAELLPEALRPWVMDIAHRMQCPADFPAVGALVALSSLVGARVVMRPKEFDNWEVVPNLWGVVIGNPGIMKSPALKEALKPLYSLQRLADESQAIAHASWDIECKIAEFSYEGRKQEAKTLAKSKSKVDNSDRLRELLTPVEAPTEPTARRFLVNDATVEKLAVLLAQNPFGTLAYRDEIYGLLTSLDKQGQEGSRAFYLTGYDGNQSYTVDRVTRDQVRVPIVCLAMLGGIQPGRIQEYVRGAVSGGSGDDGLLQRFGMAVWPDIGSFKYVDQHVDSIALERAEAVFDRCVWSLPAGDQVPMRLRFSTDAQVLFRQWYTNLEQELRSNALHPAMAGHLSKYRKLIPALALLFALIDDVHERDDDHEDPEIGVADLQRAFAWDAYLRTHANRLYAAAVIPETTNAATLLQKIRSGKLADSDGVIRDSFTPRQIVQKGWTGLNSADAARRACDLLAEYDWLRKDVVPSGDDMGRGRPSERYLINPAAMTDPIH